MKKLVFLVLFVPFTVVLQAQSKVFKEVSEDISTQFKPIKQDNELVGYLAFTRLEKASKDSFNYRVTIMDENLNDLGTVNFRGANLELQTVAFEQNAICLGYIQSSLTGVQKIRNDNALEKVRDAAFSSQLLVQWISLSGKVLNTWSQEVTLMTAPVSLGRYGNVTKATNVLSYGMQIRNVPKVGFCLFYGDNVRKELVLFNDKGSTLQRIEVPGFAGRFELHASATYIYLLEQKNGIVPEGGYRLFVYYPEDLNPVIDFDLRDSKDNWLKVLSFDNDPVTGDAFVAGCIINPRMEKDIFTAIDYPKGPYIGLFTIDLGGPGREMKANCSYWDDEKFPGLSKEGYFSDKGFYVKYASASKDFNGSTIFTGTALSPMGRRSYRLADGVFVRQEASGKVVLDNNVLCDVARGIDPEQPLKDVDFKDFYPVVNPDTRNNYMIIDDAQNIFIYNVSSKKLLRTVPHKNGNIRTDVYPAKAGHIIVAEYNQKEKYTRFSIEAP